MEKRSRNVDPSIEAFVLGPDGVDDRTQPALLTEGAIERLASESAGFHRKVQLVIPESPWQSTAWIALGPTTLAAVLLVCLVYLN